MCSSKRYLRRILAVVVLMAVGICIGCYVCRRVYEPFQSSVRRIKIGDSIAEVRATMGSYKPTPHNEDLGIGTNALVFRRLDLVWIFYLDEKGRVVRIEDRKT